MSIQMTASTVMWKAIVFTEARTPCGISSGIPEHLPGLHCTHQEAMAAALAAMKDRPELYCCTVSEVSSLEVRP